VTTVNRVSEANDWKRTVARLTAAFGAPFSVTVLSGVSDRALRPVIQNLTINRHRVVIPIGEKENHPAVAVATLDGHPSELLERLLGIALRSVQENLELDQQRLELQACSRQISHDFEELNWLHRQLRVLGSCGATGSPTDFAEGLLISLCKIVDAEAAVLVGADRENTPAVEELPLVGRTVRRFGPRKDAVEDDSCRRLVDRLREIAGKKPLVLNDMKRRREFSMAPGIHSCILAPVIRASIFYGWVLALNHISAEQGSGAPVDGCEIPPPEDEFGTSEAQVAESAGVLLALHPRCEELF
jgi:hypothetical protein